MIFNSWIFTVFMAMVFILSWWGVFPSWRRDFFVIALFIFFSYEYPPHTLLLLILTIWVYFLGQAIWELEDKETLRGLHGNA